MEREYQRPEVEEVTLVTETIASGVLDGSLGLENDDEL